MLYLWFHLETCIANLPRGDYFSILLKAHLAIAYEASVRTYVLGSLTGPVMLMSAPMVVYGQKCEEVESDEEEMLNAHVVGSDKGETGY